ncbi:MAG: UDP-N-acetylmuramate--L-alanine ligase [Armatimonadetes bacterium]|nr:UDP-N-acetylmuramate--L-alanine ligase [Armatimonadota bacterium]
MAAEAGAMASLRPGTRVHFVGIGGAGMSALARALLARGCRVSGSDLREAAATRRLAALGAAVEIGHRAGAPAGSDLVVVSRAIPPTNVEVEEARRLGIPVWHRAELLGRLLSGGRAVAVSGTHGKTTTTAMIAAVLAAGGLDPTAFVGADVAGLEGNVRLGSSDVTVAEVDESDGSLLLVRPWSAVITSLEATDHMDHYGSFDAMVETFAHFLARLPREGFALVSADQAPADRLLGVTPARALTYGLEDDTAAPGGVVYTARTVEVEGLRRRSVVNRGGRDVGELTLPVPGRHNLANAVAAVAVAMEMGVPFDAAARALGAFRGADRRFAMVGEAGGVVLVDDYAHNPTKVAAALRAARETWPRRRLVAVFQPHRYTRTQTLHAAFGPAFTDADEVIVTEIYAADEPPIPGVTARLIFDAVRAHHRAAHMAPDGNLVDWLLPRLRPGDVVMTLGAGDIGVVAHAVLDRLRQRGTGAAQWGA